MPLRVLKNAKLKKKTKSALENYINKYSPSVHKLIKID